MRLKTIHKMVEAHFEIDNMLSNTHRREVVFPRQIFCYLAYKHLEVSYRSIGIYIGFYRGKKYDHSTVVHANKTIKNLMHIDKNVKLQVQKLEGEINAIKTEIEL